MAACAHAVLTLLTSRRKRAEETGGVRENAAEVVWKSCHLGGVPLLIIRKPQPGDRAALRLPYRRLRRAAVGAAVAVAQLCRAGLRLPGVSCATSVKLLCSALQRPFDTQKSFSGDSPLMRGAVEETC